MSDASRTKYLQPQEAIDYGLIDSVLETNEQQQQYKRPSFMDALAADKPGF